MPIWPTIWNEPMPGMCAVMVYTSMDSRSFTLIRAFWTFCTFLDFVELHYVGGLVTEVPQEGPVAPEGDLHDEVPHKLKHICQVKSFWY